MRHHGVFGDCGGMSAYILEIQAVNLRDGGAVGYGIDDLGREFAVALDHSLATVVASSLDDGRRPIVAVEGGRPIRLQPRSAQDGPQLSDPR